MDRIFSARLDEEVVAELKRVTRLLGISTKRFLEEAIRLRAAQGAPRASADQDIWETTCGAWKRREAPTTTVRRSRRAMRATMERHHRR